MMPTVSGVFGRWIVMKSARSTTSVDGVQQFDAHLAGPTRRHVRIERDQAHPEGRRSLSHQGPDAPESDDSEGLPVKLDALPLLSLPPAPDQSRVGLRNVAGLREEQSDRVLGGREDVRLRRVDDQNAVTRCGIDVDVVEPDPGTADDLQVVGLLE